MSLIPFITRKAAIAIILFVNNWLTAHARLEASSPHSGRHMPQGLAQCFETCPLLPPPNYQPSYQSNSGCRNQASAMTWTPTLILEMAHKINVLLQGHLQVTEVWLRQGQLCLQSKAIAYDAGKMSPEEHLFCPVENTGQLRGDALLPHEWHRPRWHTAAAGSHHNGARGPGQWKGHHSCS